MADQFVAEIRIFSCNFAPTGWATCDGQILPISQNTALFSLLGTTYGGNGQSNFALPNFQGRTGMQQGQGPGLSLRDLGEQSGSDNITLLLSEMPAHTHVVNCKGTGGQPDPLNLVWASSNAQKVAANFYAPAKGSGAVMNPAAISITGGSLPHNNLMPYLTLNYCIALQGIFPPRT